MSWLNVPHQKQTKAGWCLPACIAMIAAYWQRNLKQAEIARWLGVRGGGAPASRVQRLTEHGFDVTYSTGSLSDLHTCLAHNMPIIVFVRTGELPYWGVDTPHAVIVAGIEGEQVYLFDPAFDTVPVTVNVGDLMLAWSYFDYTYAVLRPSMLQWQQQAAERAARFNVYDEIRSRNINAKPEDVEADIAAVIDDRD